MLFCALKTHIVPCLHLKEHFRHFNKNHWVFPILGGTSVYDKVFATSDIINKQLQNVTSQIEQQKVLVQRLQSLADILQQGKQPSVELLLNTLWVTVMFEKYYSSEQLEKLAKKGKRLEMRLIKPTKNGKTFVTSGS